MDSVIRPAFIGYTIGTISAFASASLPKKEIPVKQDAAYVFSCTTQSRSELSEFMMKHSEVSFKSIWDDPAEDIWDTL